MKRRHLQTCSACNGGAGGSGAEGLASALPSALVEREEGFFSTRGCHLPTVLHDLYRGPAITCRCGPALSPLSGIVNTCPTLEEKSVGRGDVVIPVFSHSSRKGTSV